MLATRSGSARVSSRTFRSAIRSRGSTATRMPRCGGLVLVFVLGLDDHVTADPFRQAWGGLPRVADRFFGPPGAICSGSAAAGAQPPGPAERRPRWAETRELATAGHLGCRAGGANGAAVAWRSRRTIIDKPGGTKDASTAPTKSAPNPAAGRRPLFLSFIDVRVAAHHDWARTGGTYRTSFIASWDRTMSQ